MVLGRSFAFTAAVRQHLKLDTRHLDSLLGSMEGRGSGTRHSSVHEIERQSAPGATGEADTLGRFAPASGAGAAVGETVILLHPPLPLVGVSMETTRECQQNDSFADGQAGARKSSEMTLEELGDDTRARVRRRHRAEAEASRARLAVQVSHGLQLQSLWRIPTAAVG